MQNDMVFTKKMEDIVAAIREAGLDPYAQLSGYLRTGNDAYITQRHDARAKIKGMDTARIRQYLDRAGQRVPVPARSARNQEGTMKIITISREFGSGGRELGHRLAELLGVPCYDQALIDLAAARQGIDPSQVERIPRQEIPICYALTAGRRFEAPPAAEPSLRTAVAQQEVLRRLARQGDCVIVGRCAGVILRELEPLNVFVHADIRARLARCAARAPEGEQMTEAELLRRMQQIDKGRAACRELFADGKWGSREVCHLCVNTTGREIGSLAAALAGYAEHWFSP